MSRSSMRPDWFRAAVEHYEIAGYGVVRTFASLLGENDAAEMLQETLDEEGETDKKLTGLAEEIINVEASDAEEEGSKRGERKQKAGANRHPRKMIATSVRVTAVAFHSTERWSPWV